MESMFSADNFSEVDTCVEILTPDPKNSSTSRSGGNGSVSDKSSRSSRTNKSKNSSRSYRSRTSRKSQKAAKIQKTKQLLMRPIDEDEDDAVREDVRNIIAKIRGEKHRKPQQSQDQGDSMSEANAAEMDASKKKMVAPGKYGESNFRTPSAQARKEVFDRLQNGKMPTKNPRATSKSVQLNEYVVKKGYYKNLPHSQEEKLPEQMISKETQTKIEKLKQLKRSLAESFPRSNASVESVAAIEKTTAKNSTRKPISSRLQVKAGRQEAGDAELFECVLAPSMTFASVREETDIESISSSDELREQPETETESELDGITDNDDSSQTETEEEAPTTEEEVETEKEEETEQSADEGFLKPDPSGLVELKQTFSDLRLNRTKSSLRRVPEHKPCIVDSLDSGFDALESETETSVSQTEELHARKAEVINKNKLEKAADSMQKPAPVLLPTLPVATPEVKAVTSYASGMESSLQATTQHTSDQSDTETRGFTTDTDGDGAVELFLADDSLKMKQLENENAKLKDTLRFLQQTAVEKEKYFAELAWFGKRNEEEVQKWRPKFWSERLADFGPELFEEFRADAARITDPDIGDWEHGFSSGALALSRLLLGLSHATEDEKICAFHEFSQPCTEHCVTCTIAQQRRRELEDFPVLDP